MKTIQVTKATQVTKEHAAKVLEVVDAGLVEGMGNAQPGYMCVEAAVAYAYGEPHTDRPKCVTEAIRITKIALNDHIVWFKSNNDVMDRAKGLRRIAIAQLGTAGRITDKQWLAAVATYLKQSSRFKTEMAEYRAAVTKWKKQHGKEIAQVKRAIEAELKSARKSLLDQFNKGLRHIDYSVDIVAHIPHQHVLCKPEVTGGENPFDYLNVETVAEANKVVEDLVQVLVKLKAPGTKYLYLAPLKKAKKRPAKKVAKKAKRKAKR